MSLNKKYVYPTTPKAKKEAIILGDKYRFTILTSRLLRIEYNEEGYFEDNATQTVINRDFDVPNFTVEETDHLLKITTEYLELTYTKEKFSKQSLSIQYIGKNNSVSAGTSCTIWYFNQNAPLPGTARTLDGVNGACALEPSIMSRHTITILDDSSTATLREDGFIEPRKHIGIDNYLFCYGDVRKGFDFKACLKDFYKLTGNTPLLPRYALGNWWSRYHAYTQEEYTSLIKRFKKEEVPFSVAVIDMDWHYVAIDSKYGTGWTGYTWNKNLFPDHKEFLAFLHQEGMKTSLNLHPQEGVGAHEKAYKAMAEAMGVDTTNEPSIPFEIENPEFIEHYFAQLHHPLEEEGVDFWWIDWQQGNTTKLAGIDPLWMLNHFHYIDNQKDNNRGLIFSRYAGPGSHRYPTGFSGDTVISWDSLDFQPYFTACASNIGYGWWSHDIGGHWGGHRDEELITRWFQLGVFSPINRLHSTASRFLGKEPWKYNKVSEISMKKFLKLRHELIPYLYTMNYKASVEGEPLVQPLYYNWNTDKSYHMKNEFTFGSEFLVAPITKPHDKETTLGSTVVYLPDGIWYDFFNHFKYTGNRTITMYRNLYEMPVLVKAGGIIPMAKLSHVNDIENPQNMKVKVFAGDNNTFTLYEDDGISTNYQAGNFVTTDFTLRWRESPEFVISKPVGDTNLMTSNRNFEIEFVGLEDVSNITVTENGATKEFSKCYENGVLSISLENVNEEIIIQLNNVTESKNNTLERLQDLIEHFEYVPSLLKDDIYWIVSSNESMERILTRLSELDLSKTVFLALTELLCADI